MEKFENPLYLYEYISREMKQIPIEICCDDGSANPDNDGIILKIRDRGIGISYDHLQGMQHIGNMLDNKSAIQAAEMPGCWKPTGSFGIGMQTIFYFAKEFKLKTRTMDEKLLRKMKFHSTQMGGKIDTYFVRDAEDEKFGYGTEIQIHISSQMMEAVQEKGFWEKNVDFFSDKKEIYKTQIKSVLREIRGRFGIPIFFDQEYFPGQSLRHGFGKCFIDIRNHGISEVKEQTDKDKDKNENEEGFSCWDSKNKIFIRYAPLGARNKRPKFKVYINEILVDAHPLTKMFTIDFWETEVYIFSDHVDDLIEINRERFLHEKLQLISRKICDAHVACMTLLLQDSFGEDYQKIIWRDAFYENVKKYYRFLLLKQRFEPTHIGTKCYIRENTHLRHITKMDMDYLKGTDAKTTIGDFLIDRVWLMDMRHSFFTDLHLKRADEEVFFITEDILYGFQNLAVCEIKILEQLYNDRLILYKTTSRSEMPVKISEDSLKKYILQRLNVDKCSRLILPGIEEYKELRVAKLIGSLGTSFEKQFDSSIIFPLSSEELGELLKMKTDSDVRKHFQEEVFSKENYSYQSIVKYVERYRCSHNEKFNPEAVRGQYIKLVLHVWELLKR